MVQTDPRERKLVEALAAERRRQGISETRFAKMIGASRSGICHIEAGRSHPTLLMLLRMTDGLGVKLRNYLD
jgi:transcriptional regulator with XRE-family HTH domain